MDEAHRRGARARRWRAARAAKQGSSPGSCSRSSREKISCGTCAAFRRNAKYDAFPQRSAPAEPGAGLSQTAPQAAQQRLLSGPHVCRALMPCSADPDAQRAALRRNSSHQLACWRLLVSCSASTKFHRSQRDPSDLRGDACDALRHGYANKINCKSHQNGAQPAPAKGLPS